MREHSDPAVLNALRIPRASQYSQLVGKSASEKSMNPPMPDQVSAIQGAPPTVSGVWTPVPSRRVFSLPQPLSPLQTYTTTAGICQWFIFSASWTLYCDEAQWLPDMWQVALHLDNSPLLTVRYFDLFSFSLRWQGNVFSFCSFRHLTNEILFLSLQ